MKRLGVYTGKIYSENDYKEHKIDECAIIITDEQANDHNFIKSKYERIHNNCVNCIGCPEYLKGCNI